MDYILTSYGMISSDYLAHHGVKGMKWGVRRYQNYDGTRTQAGLKKYNEAHRKAQKAADDFENDEADYKSLKKARKEEKQAYKSLKKDYKYDKNRAKALSSFDKKEVLKRQGYLSNDELHSKVGRMQDVDYLRQKTVKQYSEAQKAAIHVAEKLATTAITAGALVIAAKVAKKKLANNPVYQKSMKAIRETIAAGKKAADTVNNAKDSAVKVAKNVSKISDVTERGARMAARAAEKKGGVSAAKKAYAAYKKLHG